MSRVPHMTFVYCLPSKLSDGYCFADGVPITFLNVDWFQAPYDPSITQYLNDEEIIDFVKEKTYYDPTRSYLIIQPSVNHSFMIGPAK